MKVLVSGLAALFAAATLLAAVPPAAAQGNPALASETDRTSYMVGHDVARSIEPAAQDIDLAAFEEAIRNALEGGKPLIAEAEVEPTGRALMMRIASRAGRAPAGAEIPEVDRRKVGHLVGADVGRSLVPMKAELSVPTMLRGLRDTFAGGELAMAQAELDATREAFARKMQASMQQRMQAMAEENRAEGEAFLAENRQQKGVFTTGSGLQYMVLRQGSGPRPSPRDRVRVNYEGTLADGTVFDSSYERGEAAEFGLGDVIPGWTEGLTLMPVGAKYRFWIPGELAYGPRGAPGGQIGPNQMLIFDVELQAIVD